MSAADEGGFGAPSAPVVPQCSRAGCRAASRWRVEWRNPKIHSADRRKVWVACDEHRDYLRDYLAARDFPVEVVALSAPTRQDGP